MAEELKNDAKVLNFRNFSCKLRIIIFEKLKKFV